MTINEGPQRVNPSVDLSEAVATTSEKIAKLRNNHLLMNESTYRTQLKVPNSCGSEPPATIHKLRIEEDQ